MVGRSLVAGLALMIVSLGSAGITAQEPGTPPWEACDHHTKSCPDTDGAAWGLVAVPATVVVDPLVAAGPSPVPAGDQVPCSDDTGCPDLSVDARRLTDTSRHFQTFSPTSCSVIEGHAEPGTRELLRFTFNSPNLGTGDLVIGRPADHPEWFEWGQCHGHYHFREYADYRLWTAEGYPQWLAARAQDPTATPAQVLADNPHLETYFVAGHKQGFCVIDLVPVTLFVGVGGKYFSCSSNQGISVAWADEYSKFLDGQWIDITDVAPGLYVLEAEVNAERLYEESFYANNFAAVAVQI